MSDYEDFIVDPMNDASDDEKLLAMLIYLISFVTTFIGPLIIWLIKREESTFIDFHGKQYLNFLISYVIYGAVAALSILLLIGLVLAPAVGIASLVFTIMACVKAYSGERWKIPFVIQFIK